jgi:hypothetical protein
MINSNYKKSKKSWTIKQVDNQIDEIINELCLKSKLNILVSESGLGIAQKFYDRPLASNIIYQSNVLYSKHNKITRELGYVNTTEKNKRIVSFNYVEDLNNYYIKENINNDLLNLIVTASFQVGEYCLNHGYVCITLLDNNNNNNNSINKRLFFHITSKVFDKKLSNDYLSNSIIKLIYHYFYNSNTKLLTSYLPEGGLYNDNIINIDIINDEYGKPLINELLTLRNTYYKCTSGFLVTQDNNLDRIDSYIRNINDSYKEFYIFKGSFIILNNHHLNIAKTFTSDNNHLLFSISINSYDKTLIDNNDLIERINIIIKLGYDVYINYEPLFSDFTNNLSYLFNFIKIKNIKFILGYDVFTKLIKEEYKNIEGNLDHYYNYFNKTYSNNPLLQIIHKINFIIIDREDSSIDEDKIKFNDKFIKKLNQIFPVTKDLFNFSKEINLEKNISSTDIIELIEEYKQ